MLGLFVNRHFNKALCPLTERKQHVNRLLAPNSYALAVAEAACHLNDDFFDANRPNFISYYGPKSLTVSSPSRATSNFSVTSNKSKKCNNGVNH